MRRSFILIVTLSVALAVGCEKSERMVVPENDPQIEEGESTPDPDASEETTPAQSQPILLSVGELAVGGAVNDFGIGFFRELASRTEEDMLFSPLSLSLDLSLCAGGATGQTRTQMLGTLGFENKKPEDVAGYYKKLVEGLGQVDPNSQFMSANSVWTDLSFPLSSEYCSYANEYYKAHLSSLDLSKRESLCAINQWCKEATGGMIDKVLDDSKDPENKVVSYLLNALYFKGGWSFDFDEEQTTDVFYGVDEEKSTSYLTVHEEFPYQEAKGAQWISLSFGNGAYSLVVALPEEGLAIKDFMAGVSWMDFFMYAKSNPVQLQIPEFTMESLLTDELKDVLVSMGMDLPFDAHSAEFGEMFDKTIPDEFYIGSISQKLRFQLDRTGAEAAAVTEIGIVGDSPGGPEPAERLFIANRPFIFALVEITSRTILFIGQKTGC